MEFARETVSNRQLIEACARGDSEAIGLFYERYKNLIYSAIHRWRERYGRGEHGSEDVTEVFHDAIVALMENNFGRLARARDPERISGLVFLVSFQTAGRYFEKKWRESAGEGEIDSDVPGSDDVIDRISREERRLLVAGFLETLQPLERHILELYYAEELKYREIASLLGISESNVGVKINRVKKKMRKFICDQYGTDFDV